MKKYLPYHYFRTKQKHCHNLFERIDQKYCSQTKLLIDEEKRTGSQLAEAESEFVEFVNSHMITHTEIKRS